jgi:DNA-binding HxlR family transcriptional regulator
MVKCSFAHMDCSVALTLDCIGEWWTMLIVRDLMLFNGIRRFEQLRDGLGISRNILTERLRGLVEQDIVEKVPIAEGARRMEYHLTAKGWDLMPILVALMQWGDKWRPDPENTEVQFLDKRDHQPIAPIVVTAADGRPLSPQDMEVRPLKAAIATYLAEAK